MVDIIVTVILPGKFRPGRLLRPVFFAFRYRVRNLVAPISLTFRELSLFWSNSSELVGRSLILCSSLSQRWFSSNAHSFYFSKICTSFFHGSFSCISDAGKEYFPTFQIGLFQLFVTWTGENFPDIMYSLFLSSPIDFRMPAYTESRAMALVFILFICTCVYVLQTILLGVIYDNYRRQAVVFSSPLFNWSICWLIRSPSNGILSLDERNWSKHGRFFLPTQIMSF